MITLPKEIMTTMLRSFWVILCSSIVFLIVFIVYVFTESFLSLLLLLLIPVMVFYGYNNIEFISKFYRFTNRVLFKIKSLVSGLSLQIIYYIFFFSYKISNNNTRYFITKDSKEMRGEFTTIITITGVKGVHDITLDSRTYNSWLNPFVKWIYKTKKWWMLSIIPFIFIISIITDSNDEKPVFHNTYTLY